MTHDRMVSPFTEHRTIAVAAAPTCVGWGGEDGRFSGVILNKVGDGYALLSRSGRITLRPGSPAPSILAGASLKPPSLADVDVKRQLNWWCCTGRGEASGSPPTISRVPPRGIAIAAQTPDILGERQSGQYVGTQNVMACQSVANIVKPSLGPAGLDKFATEAAIAILRIDDMIKLYKDESQNEEE